MADIIKHARAVSPWFIPNKGGDARDLHGITNISGGASVSSEDVYVVGKQAKCGTDRDIPESSVPVTQLERGEIESYLTLANLDEEPAGGLDLNDFSSALVDVVLYEKEVFDGNVTRTIWFPKTAIASLELNIADPEARIERSFELTGDNKHELNYTNKVLLHKKATIATGVSGATTIDLTTVGVPVVDPNNSGAYILRVDRTRSGVTTTLTAGTDYTYTVSGEVLNIAAAVALDEYNVYFSGTTFGSAGDPTSVDAASQCYLKAENVTVLISDGTTEVELDKLTSLSISATITRLDEGVIGNDEKILREIEETPVSVSLDGRIDASTLAEAFMGKIGEDHGITDIKRFLDANVRLTVKIFDSADKDNFLIGYQVEDLSFNNDNEEFTANEFGTISLESSSDNLKITTTEGDLT